jgi:glycogen debranching enzyme
MTAQLEALDTLLQAEPAGEDEPVQQADGITPITLKSGDAVLITDDHGDFHPAKREMGLFWHGTRFLHVCNLSLYEQPLTMLCYDIANAGDACQFDLTNAPFTTASYRHIAQGEIHIHRQVELRYNQCIQTFIVTSFHDAPVSFKVGLDIESDFCDMFEVRGWVRQARGELHAPVQENESLLLSYRGLDAVERRTLVTFTPLTETISSNRISWNLSLSRGQSVEIRVVVKMSASDKKLWRAQEFTTREESLVPPTIHSNDAHFNRLLRRGLLDLVMLSASTPYGYVPYAGIPWFACLFGRDSLIACLQNLPWFPQLTRGSLSFLAAHQGTKIEPFTDEQPGKILHELRQGEMANLGEIPYIPYDGSIDVTPLFLITLEQYVRWTNDLAFLEQLWPNAEAAVRWIEEHGDKDGDTFLEYQTASEQGLSSQGWKDAWDSVSLRNGELAIHPTALCEVQGYAYAAYRAMSYLGRRLGKRQEIAHWEQLAENLRANFLQRFWWEEEQVFYMALDGLKRPCEVVTSNAGQCLWTGIVPEEKARKIIDRLMRDDMYSGWGIRTLSTRAARYNPMSYHNGSVWPHDTAIVGAGFAHYDGKAEAGKLLQSMFESSLYYGGARLPELQCGFPKRPGCGPTRYPVACSPQAWAAGAPLMLLNSLLGLEPDAQQQRLVLRQPALPTWLQTLEIRGMYVGQRRVHLRFARRGEQTYVIIGEDNEVDIRKV